MKKQIRDEILILSDNRPGNLSQSIGLAQELGFDYKIITLTYNFLVFLPNFLLQNSTIHLSCESKKSLKNINYLPHRIISTGRRSAPVALHLKKQSKNQSKIIQIMNPNLSLKKFDFVILPQHDEIEKTASNNVITTIGSLTKINDNIINAESDKFSSWFSDIDNTKIALLVGGSSNKTIFTKESAEKLAKLASRVTKNMNATLLVLNSRRTSDEITETLKSNLNCDFKFFDWKDLGSENPYLAIISYADFFIITGDSVSMISECCSSGKPVYIFDDQEISSPKHHQFHLDLFLNKYAKKLAVSTERLQNFPSKKLQETKRVAGIIRGRL